MIDMSLYGSTILALGAMGALMLTQLLFADVVGIKLKHQPGATIPTDHNNLLFRSARTVANTNESIAIFLLTVVFCMLSNANPAYVSYASWGFVASRALYAICYYANLQLLRSTTFGVSLVCLLSLLITGLAVWF